MYGGPLRAAIWKRTMAGLHAGLPVRELPPPYPSYVVPAAGNLVPAVHRLIAAGAATRLRFTGLRVDKMTRKVAARAGQLSGVAVAQRPAPGVHATGRKVALTVTR